MKQPPRFRPEDPQVGDLVFVSPDDRFDVSDPDAVFELAGAVSSRGELDTRGGLLNYRLRITRVNGEIFSASSQDCRCLRTVRERARNFSEVLSILVARLEKAGDERDIGGLPGRHSNVTSEGPAPRSI